MTATGRILIVDDEKVVRQATERFLGAQGFTVASAATLEEAIRQFHELRPDAVIIDYRLPDGTALDLIPRLRNCDPDVQLLVLTGYGSIDVAVQAMKVGADHFLEKPADLHAVRLLLERLLENRRRRHVEEAGRSRESRHAIDPFIGTSRAITSLREDAVKVARSDSPILLQGETGTGKGVLANWIHRNSRRADQPFVDLNCAGLSKEFLDSELFGHARGAFTGAVAEKRGLLEVSDRGTIFLDEIGDIDLDVQPKLLKVLEEKRFRRLGETRDRTADIRLVAASHHDLQQRIGERLFRADLYYRISTVTLLLPPLRERREDVAPLARHILSGAARDLGRRDARFTDDALAALEQHAWPGNIRELRNVIERALLLGESSQIDSADLRLTPCAATAAPFGDPNLTLDELERIHIERVLREESGSVQRAAARLGIQRNTLYARMRKYGLR